MTDVPPDLLPTNALVHAAMPPPSRRHHASRIVAIAALAVLSGCGNELSRTFGLTRDAPDEFTVTTRAPLSMPPNFQLRPPRPGASRPQEQSEQQQVEATLAPEATLAGTPAGGASPGQQTLLNATGPRAPRDIRNRVDGESQLDQPGTSFTDTLMFWRRPTASGVAVDPARESQRLRQNAALGQSPQAGDTPIIQPKRGGLLDGLF